MTLSVVNNFASRFTTVPNGWTQRRMRAAVKAYQQEKNEYPNPQVLSLTKSGLKVKTDLTFGKSTENYVGHQLVSERQFVFTPRDFDATPILCGVASDEGCISNLYLVFDVADEIHPEFLEYYFWGLKYGYEFFEKLSFGMRYSFNRTQFEQIPLLHPDLPTQKRIAAFLDRETACIDALIAKKERLVEQLASKLSREITKSVTRGLDPSADLKGSKVDWIGEIPVHWNITKLGYLGRCANGINIGGDAFGSGYPFISYGDVYRNRALPTKVSGLVKSSDADRKNYSVKKGDVLFTRTSETIEEVGFSSVCMETIENAVYAGFLIRFRPLDGKLTPLFSKFSFQHSGLRNYFAKEMNLITRASLSQDLLRNMPVALPPIEEQEAIAVHLEALEEKIFSISEKTNTTISQLKERRAALITAAVTGQIDVEAYAHTGASSAKLDQIEEEMQG